MNTQLWRRLHRWAGLLLAAFILFYCLTGLLLNHRKAFDYFIDNHKTVSQVARTDTTRLRDFIETYKRQINRNDDPKVIRIRDGDTIEFLYGSHGRTTYIIHPGEGVMEKIDKQPRQPFARLNGLHKAFKTGPAWLWIADAVTVLVLFLVVTGMVVFRYRPLDYLLVFGGVLLLALGMFVA